MRTGDCIERTFIKLGMLALLSSASESPSGTACSGQPIPDSGLSFSSATAGGSPSLN